MQIDQLETLRWLVQGHTMEDVARRLSVSQPTVSYRLNQLEDELGFPIWKRGRAGGLTPQGSVFWRYAESALVTLELGRQAAQRPQANVCVIGASPTLAATTLAESLIQRVRDERWQYDIRTGHSHELEQWLTTGLVDLAFTRHPTTHCLLIAEDPLVLVGSPMYGHRPPTLDNLASLPFIALEPTGPHWTAVRELCAAAGVRELHEIIAVDHTLGILPLIRQGLGFSVLAYSHVRTAVAAGEVTIYAVPPLQWPTRPLYLGWHGSRWNTVVDSWARQMRQYFRDGPT
ncbi:MAG: LysR family transcriptional regulator [Sulfobacillus sp.]